MLRITKSENNFVDALEKDHRFAVLVKPGRIQILLEPSAKQLRKRGKRGWELFGLVDDCAEAEKKLGELLQRVMGLTGDKPATVETDSH